MSLDWRTYTKWSGREEQTVEIHRVFVTELEGKLGVKIGVPILVRSSPQLIMTISGLAKGTI